MTTTNSSGKMSRLIVFLILAGVSSLGLAYATTCSVVSSATVPVGASEDITISCSEIGSGYTVTISASGYTSSCITVSPSSKQITSTNPSTTFSTTGVSMSCAGNVNGRKVTWTFTHSGGNSIASKTTVYNVIPMPSVTPTFDKVKYNVTNGTSDNVSITLALTTSQSQVDIRNINVMLSTSFNGTQLNLIDGLENKTGITIDVSESTTQYVTWNLELPPLPPGMEYDFNASVSADNANDAAANTIINVTIGEAGGPQQYLASIGLNSGWNLVSVPIQASNMSAARIFGSIPNLNYAWGYNASDTLDPWKVWTTSLPPAARDLRVASNNFGYWVKVSALSQINVTGTAVNSLSMSLKSGWNLVGYPFLTGRSAASSISGLSSFSYMWGYNSSDHSDPWKVYTTSLPPAARDLKNLSPGYGYWIKVNSQESWTLG